MPPKKTEPKTEPKVVHTSGGEVLVSATIPEKQLKEIEDLYAHSNKLDTDPTSNESSYQAILKSVKGSEKAKQFAATLIPKYFKFFPKHAQDAINALLDLCEEETREVRISAIRALPLLCKDEGNLKYVGQIGSVLFQLLLADDVKELEVVNWAIQEILNLDPEASLKALFAHIESKEDASLREKNIEFLKTKIIGIDALMSIEKVEKLCSDELDKILKTATLADFLLLAEIYLSLKSNKNVEKKKILFGHAVHVCGLDKFNVGDKASVLKLCDFINSTLALLAVPGHVISSPFWNFFVKSVLSQFEKFDDREKLHLVRTLAEISKFTTTSDSKSTLGIVYQLLLKYLPLKNKEGEKEPLINFSNIESLLYVFVQLGHKSPGSLNPICGIKINTGQPTDDIGDYKELFEDLKNRLTFCKDQAGIIRYNSKQAMMTADKEYKAKEQKTPEDEKTHNDARTRSQLASRIMGNIIRMADMILKKEFVSIGELYLSWKKQPEKEVKPQGEKKQEKPQQEKKRKNDKKDKNAKKKKTQK